MSIPSQYGSCHRKFYFTFFRIFVAFKKGEKCHFRPKHSCQFTLILKKNHRGDVVQLLPRDGFLASAACHMTWIFSYL